MSLPPRPPAPFEKDVQAVLMKQRAARRRPGEFGSDNWDQMFLQSCFGGLTVHQFDTPPNIILDLGCGGGYWAMEAAKQWPNAHVIGLDLKDIQPELYQLDAYYMRCLEDCRLRWVHGNLLDGLPFPSDYFDFVHISNIGLGVPEDEVCSFLEVSRVLKCNGILEDSAPPSAFSTRSSNTMISDLWSPESPDDQRVQKKPSLPTLPETYSTDSSSRRDSTFDTGSLTSSSLEPSLSRLGRDNTFFPGQDEMVAPDHHPEDHTRLKAAWDAMLSRRFLAASVITVLPFYLSSFFDNVQTYPSIQISIPPSSTSPDSGSRSSDDSFEADTLFDPNPLSTRLGDTDMYSIKSKSTSKSTSSQRTVVPWGRMHLAKTVNTVSACKEAVWAEYQQLFPGDLPPIIANTVRPNARYRPLKHSPREAFETDWTAWEHDMADRMSMRGRVTSEFGWPEPEPSPDWRIWRNRMSSLRGETLGEQSRSSPTDLCRSLRAFVGWKPAAP
ncbi:hypothetical protein B0H19DRAFT_1189137 [Mycena capillaripes]|nr:hypothetical protein B0H19DRAFT_1189137 [Mycena capillaripes]